MRGTQLAACLFYLVVALVVAYYGFELVDFFNCVMKFFQREIVLPPFPRGFHLITKKIESEFIEIKQIEIGQLQVFIKHTSASLSLNENADPTVRGDFERHFNVIVPENARYYQHDTEGPDDMPAHIKASLLGSSVIMPITAGRLNLGMWQGVYLCEHRNHAEPRGLVLTAFGSSPRTSL